MHKHTTGLSLIELLISLMLMAVLLLGIDAMQIAALQHSMTNYHFAVAKQQIDVMHERRILYRNNAYLLKWNEQNQKVLPQGYGIVKSNPKAEIAIFWGNKNEQNCQTNQVGAEGCLHLK